MIWFVPCDVWKCNLGLIGTWGKGYYFISIIAAPTIDWTPATHTNVSGSQGDGDLETKHGYVHAHIHVWRGVCIHLAVYSHPAALFAQLPVLLDAFQHFCQAQIPIFWFCRKVLGWEAHQENPLAVFIDSFLHDTPEEVTNMPGIRWICIRDDHITT